MSDTGGGSGTSPAPGMSDSEGVVGRTTSASGMSRTSGTSRTSLVASAPTTTISTIAVQSGNTRIVIALLQSAEWLELRVVELTPGMVYLGATLEEATQLLQAHEEVLAKLQSKQSPVEDLLNQADQLISTQRPRAEVYASMAESLGLAWKDLNAQLETRKQILDMGVAFHTRARQYSDSMDAAERVYTDNVLPGDAEGARQLLSQLHDHKRAILEASMYTLQEAQALLARLRGLATEGASLDSRPQHIKTNIEFACSQIEHYLESLHDRRRFLDGLFSARKHHLEQCLALCLLYQDLTEAVTSLKQLRDEVSEHQGLGESQGNAEILLHEHLRREAAAKEQQDKCIRLLKTAERMASGGHYAGLEARSRAYSVLEAATALHETCDTRTALLQQSILFFKLAQTAMTKLDQAEVQVASLGGEGAQRLSLVVGVVEEAVQPALAEGYAILEVTGGRNQPHNLGISLVVEELERRRSHLSSICVSSTEQVLQRTELSNAFLEQYNTIESWLVRIGDAFLQGHQDPGGSLSLARDFLHLHQTLNNDVMEKKREIDSLETFLSKLLQDLSEEEAAGYQEKMQALKDHWDALKKVLDIRIAISDKYVKFHADAEAVNNEHESFEQLLKEAQGDDIVPQVEAKWEQLQKLYLDLCNNGKAFCQDVKNIEDPYLDTNRAVLCVENILEQLGKRRLVITDLHSHFHMKITTTKEMLILWNTYRENVKKMQSEMSSLETDFCPLLRGDPTDPEDIANTLDQRLSVYVSAVKKTQEDIQNMMTRAEVMSYKGDQGGQRDEVIGALLQLYQNLQNKATEYQILGHMLIQWCRNISEIHRSCDKLESQFGNVSLDIGGIEGQLLEHEASKQAVLELLKFAQNEATSIVTKIKEQCPPDAGAKDIDMINEMLERRGKVFETVWSHHQQMLERQLKRSQYHVDLQVISDQLRDLSEQLGRMRGHYGDSLAAAKNMQTAFVQFKITVDMLERRIQTFVSTAVKMLGQDDDSGEVQQELAELEKKWSTFQRQVGESEKSIELSIDFFKLVEEAEDWFKDGSKLLVTVASESSNIQNPDQAQKLRKRIEHFLQPGEQAQAERITKISSLALQLYGSASPRQIEVVSHQNTHMLESFNIINRNLEMLIINLKNAEDLREKQKREKEELAASLTSAQAEAEAARLAAAAAEEARRAAEEVARTMAIPVEPIVPERVEIEIQTEAIPLPPEEPPKPEETPPAKKAKLIDDEPQHMPPVFMTPLVGAAVSEGVKFSFECRVIGFPMPEVEWLKDNMSISGNPDYKTSYEEGVCTLTIEETFTEDSALFTCRAVNAAGMAETSATLTVKEAEAVEVMAPPLFTKRLVDSTAEEGSSYQLEATVEGHPLPVVSWSKDGKCVDESPDYVITFNNGECVLRFEEVFMEDQAEYSCKATNDLGEDITKARMSVAAVELSERPKFTMPLSNVMARAGQKFKLECQVTGNPSPTVTWFHNTKPVKETPDCRLTFDGQTATLVMSEAFPKNAGTYTVVAKNSAGEAQCSANVSVKGRIPTETSDSEVASDIDAEPVKPSIQLPLKDTCIQEGRPARLDCVIVGQPEPEVIWYHDDKPVKESTDFKLLFHGDRCSLIIQEAFLEDAGIYRVVAMNSAGEASTACFLNVEPVPELAPPPEPEAPTVAPRFSQLLTDSHVTEGKPITLRASVTGQPAPTVAWFKDGVPLIPDNEFQIQENPDGSLIVHINAATLDHTGQYEIVASNAAGTAKCVAYLSIEPRLPTPPPSEHKEPPAFKKLIQDVATTSGSGVIFEAEVTGVPKPTVSDHECSIKEFIKDVCDFRSENGDTVNLERELNDIAQDKESCHILEGLSEAGSCEAFETSQMDNTSNTTASIITNEERELNNKAQDRESHNSLESLSEVRSSEALDNYKNNKDDTITTTTTSIMTKDEYMDMVSKFCKLQCTSSFEENNNQPDIEHHEDNRITNTDKSEDESLKEADQPSNFRDLRILDFESYSRFMMENIVVYGSLGDSDEGGEGQSYDQLQKFDDINVMNSEVYSHFLSSHFTSDGERREPSEEICLDNESEELHNETYIKKEEKPQRDENLSPASDNEEVSTSQPAKFFDTGIEEDIQPVKLADLWDLIKDRLPDPKSQEDGNFSFEDDTEYNRKSVSQSSDGELESGYFSGNFSNASGPESLDSGASKRSSYSLSSEETSKRNSICEDQMTSHASQRKVAEDETLAANLFKNKDRLKAANEKHNSEPMKHYSSTRENSLITEKSSQTTCTDFSLLRHNSVDKTKWLSGYVSDTESSSDSDSPIYVLCSDKYEDAQPSGIDIYAELQGIRSCYGLMTPIVEAEEDISFDEVSKSTDNDRGSTNAEKLFSSEMDCFFERERCFSGLSIISEEGSLSDHGEIQKNYTATKSVGVNTILTASDVQWPVKNIVDNVDSPTDINQSVKSDAEKQAERKARRAARLAKLRELTKILKTPSKISVCSKQMDVNSQQHGIPESSCTNPNAPDKVNMKDIEVTTEFLNFSLLKSFETIPHKSEPATEKIGYSSEPNKAFMLMIKTKESLSQFEIKQIVVEKLRAVLEAGQSLIRAYVLPFTHAIFLDFSNPSVAHQDLAPLTQNALPNMVFEVCLHATRGQGTILDGECTDPNTPGIIQAGYYLIYVLYYKDEHRT